MSSRRFEFNRSSVRESLTLCHLTTKVESSIWLKWLQIQGSWSGWNIRYLYDRVSLADILTVHLTFMTGWFMLHVVKQSFMREVFGGFCSCLCFHPGEQHWMTCRVNISFAWQGVAIVELSYLETEIDKWFLTTSKQWPMRSYSNGVCIL